MSLSYNRKKKERKASKSAEEKSLKRKVRSGVLPKYCFDKDEKNDKKLKKLTENNKSSTVWRLTDTVSKLLK